MVGYVSPIHPFFFSIFIFSHIISFLLSQLQIKRTPQKVLELQS